MAGVYHRNNTVQRVKISKECRVGVLLGAAATSGKQEKWFYFVGPLPTAWQGNGRHLYAQRGRTLSGPLVGTAFVTIILST